MRDQRWMLIEWDRVPRSSAILVAIFSHLLALSLLYLSRHAVNPHIVQKEYQAAQVVSGAPPLVLSSKPSRFDAGPIRIHRKIRAIPHMQVPDSKSVAQGSSAQSLYERAKQATAAITMSIKFRQIFGFSPTSEYKLAIQTAGQIPTISADEVPPHFEQYVIIEVTIDVDGSVAEARIVSGMVTPKIQQTLLSAVREFKYNPATRNGAPIPSQRDIVIHIPS